MKITKNSKTGNLSFRLGRKKLLGLYTGPEAVEVKALLEILSLRTGTKTKPAFVSWICPLTQCMLRVTDSGKFVKVEVSSEEASNLKLFEKEILKEASK